MRQLVLGTMLLLVGCAEHESSEGPARSEADDTKLEVYVVNYPLQYFAERIGGGRVEVRQRFWAGPGTLIFQKWMLRTIWQLSKSQRRIFPNNWENTRSLFRTRAERLSPSMTLQNF